MEYWESPSIYNGLIKVAGAHGDDNDDGDDKDNEHKQFVLDQNQKLTV